MTTPFTIRRQALEEALEKVQRFPALGDRGTRKQREGYYQARLDILRELSSLLAADPHEASEACSCLSELADDAYAPGGPMSGRYKPVCEVHGKARRDREYAARLHRAIGGTKTGAEMICAGDADNAPAVRLFSEAIEAERAAIMAWLRDPRTVLTLMSIWEDEPATDVTHENRGIAHIALCDAAKAISRGDHHQHTDRG